MKFLGFGVGTKVYQQKGGRFNLPSESGSLARVDIDERMFSESNEVS